MLKSRKILLVSANTCNSPYPVYPIGISYLASYLLERIPSIDIRVFDLNYHSLSELENLLPIYFPDYIGISLRNIDDVNSLTRISFIENYKCLISIIKKKIRAKIIIGGPAFSIFPKELFSTLDPDFGIIGEGEESLLQLISCLENNFNYNSIEGLVYKTQNIIVINERKNYLRRLSLSFDNELLPFYWNKSGIVNIQTKRGCPYNCVYCTYPLIEGNQVRTLDISNIVNTIKNLLKKRINYFFFTDSIFNIDPQYNEELCKEFIRNKLEIKWGAYFSPSNLSEKMLTLYKNSGLTHIEFGTESLSDTQLKNYGKHFVFKEILEVSDLCNRIGIYHAHFLILGGYGETEKTLEESFTNSIKIENTVFFPYIGMRIYPNTKLYKLACEEGVISPRDDLMTPIYFLADFIDLNSVKVRAKKTGKRWVFPDEDLISILKNMRTKNWKGLLWHHLKK